MSQYWNIAYRDNNGQLRIEWAKYYVRTPEGFVSFTICNNRGEVSLEYGVMAIVVLLPDEVVWQKQATRNPTTGELETNHE